MSDDRGSSSSSSSSPMKKHAKPARLAPRLPNLQTNIASASSSTSPRSRTSPLSPAARLTPAAPPSPRPPPPPLHLTVRFSTALADLHLDILSPHQTAVVTLKQLIRAHLSEVVDGTAAARRRLRFIHAGRILPDGAVLSSVLKPVPPPPLATGPRDGGAGAAAAKGKGVEGRTQQRVYVNCSVGDALGDEELAAEARAALAPFPSPLPSPTLGGAAADGRGGRGNGTSTGSDGRDYFLPRAGGAGGVRATAAATSRAPRGFDRLIQGGFTPAEVNQLRLQFRSIQATRHTPDTMPSPNTLRNMEDAWIDSNGAGVGGTGYANDGDGGGTADDEPGVVGVLDVLIKGMVIGFMFPLGTVGWLVRQEAMWSRRWRVFASFGFIMSLTIGIIRALSGDR